MVRRSPTICRTELFKSLWCGGFRRAQNNDRVIFTGYARFALLNILKALELKPGSKVLIPSYVCNVVLIPLATLQLVPVYYKVDDSFRIDLTSIPVDHDISVLLTVNYFGFGVGIESAKKLILSRGWIWINDNAHGFSSLHNGQNLDEFGDFSITSFRKTIPVLNGAYVAINTKRYSHLFEQISEYSNQQNNENHLKYFVKTLINICGFRIRNKLPEYTDVLSIEDNDQKYLRASFWGEKLMKSCNQSYIRDARRENYHLLENFFADKNYQFLSVKNSLLEVGNTPLAFPLMVRTICSQSKLLQYLRSGDIDAYAWPSLPAEIQQSNLHGAVDLLRSYIFLPLHQGLIMKSYIENLEKVLDEI
ncbi:MAG TPA: hypothetical protein DE312_09695 [Gallionella sp.]|nr:MAG: hypothetical protein A2Z87_12565 [Gallionellales bacterium GWA2_54_124]HCI53567.1 hypothetical protein [Gallionella sp.]